MSRAFFKKLGVTAESTKNEYSNHRINSTKELKMSSNSPDPPVPRGPRGPPYTMYLSSYDGKSDGNRPFKFLWKIIKSANCHPKSLGIFTTKQGIITFIFWNSLALSKVKKKCYGGVQEPYFQKLGVTAKSTKNDCSNHCINSTKELKVSVDSSRYPVKHTPRGPTHVICSCHIMMVKVMKIVPNWD